MKADFYDLVIKNGLIVNADASFNADVAIRDGKIAALGSSFKADQEIDAKGLYLLPGGIDIHTHLEMPFMGTFSSDNFESGSKAAAMGGTTAIVDYAMQSKGQSLLAALKKWHEKAANKSHIDYGFHLGLTDINENTLKELESLVKEGVSTVKLFMAYNNALRCPDIKLLEVFDTLKKLQILPMLHCENGDIIEYLSKKLINAGNTAPIYHSIAHSAEGEAESINRAAIYSKIFDLPIYIVHLSSKEGLQVIYDHLKRGVKIFAETCPQYLVLDDSLYDKEFLEASKYVMSPPLRDKDSIEALWKGLACGIIKVVATDHCPFFLKQKELGKDDFTKIPNGAPGIETRLVLIFSEGVNKGRISREQFVECCCLNPAKLAGLYPKKGAIATYFDADLVLFDPNKKWQITKNKLHENVDYTPYEGLHITGAVVDVLLRGNWLVREGCFVGEKVQGKYLQRNKATHNI
jgi:dihydropyrimidinase